MEFRESDKNVRDLIEEYQDKQDTVIDGDDCMYWSDDYDGDDYGGDDYRDDEFEFEF